jgi:S-adenosylmethionine synthetase
LEQIRQRPASVGSQKENRGMSRNGRHLFTSESVTEGHPDKIADQISDSILDAIIAQDPMSRVACETLVTTGIAFIAGEITTKAIIDYQKVVRDTIADVGYTRGKYGFDAETCAVISSIHSQSPDIAMGVDTGGAGDQGLMFGYACTETDELMPLPIMLAHKLARGLSCARRDGVLEYLRPDGKSQVTVEYDGHKPVRVDAVVVSSQHSPLVTNETMREDITDKIINRVIPEHMRDQNTKIYVNPTGRFVAPTATPASPAAKSSSIPTAARLPMAAARSPAKIPPRSIAPPATWRATSPRTWWRRVWPIARWCSSLTRSASPIRCR